MRKEFIICAIGLILVSGFFYFWAKNSIESNTPPFITKKLNELKQNKKLMDSIGGYKYFEFSYNKNHFKYRDTVRYAITIKGRDKILTYNGTQVRLSADRWELIQNEQAIRDTK